MVEIVFNVLRYFRVVFFQDVYIDENIPKYKTLYHTIGYPGGERFIGMVL